MYELLLSVHLLAVVIWVGGAATIQILITRVSSAGDNEQLGYLSGQLEWIGTHFYMPASIIALLSGIWLVVDGGWGFGSLWVLIGLAGIAYTAFTGARFLGPESSRLKALAQERGFEDAEVLERQRRLFLVSRIDLAVLLLVVLDMAFKPGA